MSATALDIVYGLASQTIYFDAASRPSGVTSVTVYENDTGDDGTAESATTGSASVEANPNTTVDANSGAGQANERVLNVAATTGFAVGRDYLVTGAAGETEWFTCAEINDGVSVVAANPFHNAFVSGDTVESTRISISVLDSWAADENNLSDSTDPNPGYRARWIFTAGGATVVRDSYFDLVRYAGAHTITPTDVERLIPGFLNQLPTYHRESQGRELIAEAYRQVKLDLYQEGKPDQTMRNREVLDELVKRKTVELWADARLLQGTGDINAAERAMSAYQERFDSLIRRTTKVPFSVDTTGAARTVPALSITRR